MRRGDGRNLHENFLGEVIQQISKYLLTFSNTTLMEGIRRRVFFPVFVYGDQDLDGLRRGSIDIVEDPNTSQLQRHLGAPQYVVGADKLLGDLTT